MENVISQSMETCGIFAVSVSSLGSEVAGLNIAPEIPAMTMFRYIIFDAAIAIISKSIFEVKND